MGNFFLDMWRVVAYMFLPAGLLFGVLMLQQGMPMTFQTNYQVNTLEPTAMGTDDKGGAKQQTIVVGPLAAFEPMKQLGTNGGGFYGMNSAHPFENPTAFTNFLECVAMMLFPMALVFMYGRMLGRLRHAWVILSVMMTLMVGTIVWSIWFDTLKPNPGLTAHPDARSLFDPERRRAGRQTRLHAAGRRRTAGRSASRQPRGQGIALWDFGGCDLRCDNGRYD